MNVEPAIITGRRAFEPNDGHWSVFDVNEAAIVPNSFDNLSEHIVWTLAYILHTSVVYLLAENSSAYFFLHQNGLVVHLPSLTAEKSSGSSNNEKICYC